MNDPLIIALAGIAGMALGTIFFGGLWWTIRRGLASPRPSTWFFGSMISRMGIALLGFYYVGKDDWKRMLACLVGFIAARLAVSWLMRKSGETGKEVIDAP